MTDTKAHPGRGNFVALAIVAVALAVMFVGAIMPTPLYPLYQRAFGFSGITLTLIYAVYVLGNLVALLFFGRLADQVGRRSAMLPAIGIGIAGTVVFAAAAGSPWLFAARALSGFSTGLAAGAATAWIADLYTGRGNGTAARIAASANFFGCAAGPLLGGLLAQFAPWPLRLPYLVYLVLLSAVAVAIVFVPETVTNPKRYGEAALRPRLGVPRPIRLQFVSPAVSGFATFSLIGFYAALIPNLLGESLHQSAPTVAGAIVCEVFGIAAITILSTAWLASQAAMFSALALLLPAAWLLVGAELARSLPLLLLRRGALRRRRRVGLSRQPRSDQPHRARGSAQRGGLELPHRAVCRQFGAGDRHRRAVGCRHAARRARHVRRGDHRARRRSQR